MIKLEIEGSDSAPEVVLRGDGEDRRLPALWLRERTEDPCQLDLVTRQRLFNPHRLPEDLHLTAASWNGVLLRLSFSDGFVGDFDPCNLISSVELSDGCPTPTPWQADLQPVPRHSWNALGDDRALLEALEDFLRLGFIIVDQTPVERDSILQVAARFGHVRETNFGRYFEVYDRPGSNDLAYRAVALGPHTDNPYRMPVPGIQLLHCLVNETSGGLSTLADSLAAAQVLREEDPEAYDLLSRVPVRFRFVDPESDMVSIRPLLEVNALGDMIGLHYSPKLDELPLMSETETRRYHRARQRLAALFSDPAYEQRFRLQPGELMMFDNNRVLHGRTAFDPTEGRRHLQGCYIDRDGPRSRYRVLKARCGAHVDQPTGVAA